MEAFQGCNSVTSTGHNASSESVYHVAIVIPQKSPLELSLSHSVPYISRDSVRFENILLLAVLSLQVWCESFYATPRTISDSIYIVILIQQGDNAYPMEL
jgi:hypothetical protein